MFVINISVCKPKVRKTRADVLICPIDTDFDNVKAVIRSAWTQELGKARSHDAYATPDIKHVVIGRDSPKVDEVFHELLVGRLILTFSSHEPKTVRRYEWIALAHQGVEAVSWKIDNPAQHQTRFKAREKSFDCHMCFHRIY